MKGLLIDLGNTVWYNLEFDFEKGLERVFKEAIHPSVDFDEVLNFTRQLKKTTYDSREEMEINFDSYLNYLKSYFNLEFKQTNAELEYLFATACERIQLIPGVVDLLEHCKKENIKVVALSNSTFSSTTLLKQARSLEVDHYFYKILSSGDHLFRKPSPYFFNLGVKVLNLPKEDVVFVGNDFYFDAYGASKAGLYSIWYNEPKLRGLATMDCLDVSSHQEVLEFIKKRK